MFKAVCCVLVLILCLTFANCQYSNNYGNNYGYYGGAGQNYGVTGGNYNQYAQNTQAYSNQISAINYQPYSSYGSYYQGPYSYGNNYGSAYSYPIGGYGGYGVPPKPSIREKQKPKPLSFFSLSSLKKMAASSSRKSRTTVLRSLSPSPSQRFQSSSSSAFASSTSSFTSRPNTFFRGSTSPTRVNLYSTSPSPSASSIRFSLDRSISPNRSISVAPRNGGSNGGQWKKQNSQPKRTCMCSPTNHPGSFRCSLHKGFGSRAATTPYSSNRLNARRSAMTNSLVRIRGVEGDLVKRALAALIRPSSHQQKRRGDFHPRPSRLSVMTKADDGHS